MSASRLLRLSAAFAALAILVASCSSTKLVKVSAEPKEAAIYMDGKKVGEGSFEKILDFGETPAYTFSAKLDRFTEEKVVVNYKPTSTTSYQLKLKRLYSVPITLYDFQVSKTASGLKFGYNKEETVAYYDILEPSEAIKGLIQITDIKNDYIYIGGPVVSPTDDYLVYSVLKVNGKSTESFIWRQAIGAKGTTHLVSEKRYASLFPTFAPTGDKLIYCSNRLTGKFALWSKDLAGVGRTKISGGLTQDLRSSMSPNGSQIAYTGCHADGQTMQIWTVNEDGRQPTQICEGYDPQFSPDGKRILFLRNSKEKKVPQLWVMNFDGGSETQLTVNEAYSIKDPRWSPDGKVIVFASNEAKDDKGRQNYDIWMMGIDGSSKTQLTQNGSHDDEPCFGRDGDQVFFRSNRGAVWNIWGFKLAERHSDKRRAFDMK